MEKIIYFDHAATSWPKPSGVFLAMQNALSEKGGNPGRSGHILSVRASRAVFECREQLCRLFSFDKPERIVFTQNATHSLNLVIKGLVNPGEHIVISNLEHNSVLRPVHGLASNHEKRISYTMFDATDNSDEDILFCFKRALRENTRLAVITAASNVCGKILPIKKISEICHARGIKLVVDGAQAGGVFPLDFYDFGADALCLAGHKGLYGPQGTGVVIFREGIEPETIFEGGNGIASQDRGMGDLMPERLEAGTVNTPGICGLCEGVKYVIKETPERIFGKTLHLSRYASEELLSLKDIVVYGNYDIKAPIIIFNKKGKSPSELSSYLSDLGICTRSGLHCAPTAHEALGSDGAVRISFGHKNTKSEIDRFLMAVKKA